MNCIVDLTAPQLQLNLNGTLEFMHNITAVNFSTVSMYVIGKTDLL